ncbi:hypothetical protein OIU34_37120 [Pararhizobium sp. BT-229]|uniref:hypothetical protein n=1 Tax=Pararhizobium sp. BT-229 TaxID=2986923 RepID=UPI0021F6F706|nr:hypothetical protein [Pararhizobium sp. BT-229]MCV9967455.1 hypothetical protein [Pararhizobium sp. BT-229]
MSTATDFIAEVVRAANEVGNLTTDEKRQLMERGVRAVREMRLDKGIRPQASVRDGLLSIEVSVLRSEIRNDDEVRAAVLILADMIRTLEIAPHKDMIRETESLPGIGQSQQGADALGEFDTSNWRFRNENELKTQTLVEWGVAAVAPRSIVMRIGYTVTEDEWQKYRRTSRAPHQIQAAMSPTAAKELAAQLMRYAEGLDATVPPKAP